MTTNIQQIWDQYYAQAVNRAAEFGYTTNDQVNAFAHTYVSALLVKDFGGAVAFIAGSGQELGNHWTYRNGGPEPQDPNQRYDSFRDLWNNAAGRMIGAVAIASGWGEAEIAQYARNSVDQGVSIVDCFSDARVPQNLSQLSSFDYLFGSHGPSAGAVQNIAPPGATFPPNSIGNDFGDLLVPQSFVDDNGTEFNVERRADGGVTVSIADAGQVGSLDSLSLEYSPDSALQQTQVVFDDGTSGVAVIDATAPGSGTVTERLSDQEIVQISSFSDLGKALVTSFDPLDTQPWDTHTVATDADGTVTADNYDYNTASDWLATHQLDPGDFTGLDEASASELVATVERQAYQGDVIGGGAPSIFEQDPYFDAVYGNQVHDLGGSSYDIDVGRCSCRKLMISCVPLNGAMHCDGRHSRDTISLPRSQAPHASLTMHGTPSGDQRCDRVE